MKEYGVQMTLNPAKLIQLQGWSWLWTTTKNY